MTGRNAVTDLPFVIDGLPRAVALPRKAPAHRWRVSLVWLVPAVAALIGGWLVVRAAWQRGPTVTITFATAEGLEPHRTVIKFKSVDIGIIKSIDLLDDRSGVLVTAELSRKAEKLLVDDARFWVVRPRVSLAGVSGIGTLLSGAHIGFDAGVSSESRRAFTGLETPPSTISDRQGTRFVLRAESVGSLDIGSPLYLRRLQVGQVTGVSLDPAGEAVKLEVFVDAPYDRHVRATTRFWNASGVDLTLNARGIKLDTQSMASVLMGGIALQTPDDAPAAALAASGSQFTLFASREAALRRPGGRANDFLVVFHGPVHGLTAGAPVELLGMDVGEVSEVNVDFDPGTLQPRTVVGLSLHADRLRVRGAAPDPGEARALLDRLVGNGLRAQLRTENMLTGQRFVAFDLVPHAPPARVIWGATPVELPAADGAPDDVVATATRLMARLEKVPLEQMVREGTATAREMRGTLERTSKLLDRLDGQVAPQMVALMGQASKTLGSVEQTLSSEAPLQKDLRATLRDLGSAGYALRSLAEYLERHPESLLRGKKEDRP
jgi:paraquat-inducible protein B